MHALLQLQHATGPQLPLHKVQKAKATPRLCRLCAAPGVLVLVLWLVLCGCAYRWAQNDVPFKGSNRVLLVTAHPDDETIFFSPLISGLTATGKKVYLLCLSTGNAYGLGDVRIAEVREAASALGVPDAQLTVLNHTLLQDGKQSSWDVDTVAEVVWDYHQRHAIDTIVTFDDLGVTQHPNHLALHAGITKLIAQCHLDPEKTCPTAWELVTNVKNVEGMTLKDHLQVARAGPDYAGYVNHNIVRTFMAMGAHKSQANWWRHILRSPLTLVNSFKRITPQSWMDISEANTGVQPFLLRLPQQLQSQDKVRRVASVLRPHYRSFRMGKYRTVGRQQLRGK